MDRATAHVVDDEGTTGVLEQQPTPEVESVAVRLSGGQRLTVGVERLVEQEEGGYHYRGRFPDSDAAEEVRVPLAHEEVRVGKEEREVGGVRIHKHVETHTEEVDHELLREHVVVDRVPVDRPLDEPAETRQEGDTLIIPLMEERLVVTKQLVLTEELHVRRRRETKHERQDVALRRTTADVERLDVDARRNERSER